MCFQSIYLVYDFEFFINELYPFSVMYIFLMLYLCIFGAGMIKNPNFLEEVLEHFGKDDEIIVVSL